MKTLKKLCIMFLTLCLASAPILGSVGCGERGPQSTKPVDKNKTQIQIVLGNNALGYEWADEIAAMFEEEEYIKTKSFEDGKMGAQVLVYPVSSGMAGTSTFDSLDSSDYDVLFLEGGRPYNNMIFNDGCANVYDLLTENLSAKFGEDKRIIDKIEEDVLYSYSLGEVDADGDPIVKGLNYWEAFWLPRYDVDLFEENGFFFKEGYNTEGIDVFNESYMEDEDNLNNLINQFVGMGPNGDPYTQEEYADGTAPRSAGEDGIKGTWDDGLPVTFQDFYCLCFYIQNIGGMTPFIWAPGSNDYQLKTLTTIWATEEGYDDFMLNLTHEGTDNDLIASISADGEILEYGSVTLDPSQKSANGIGQQVAQLQKQKGKYYALEFAEKILRSNFYPSSVNGMSAKVAGDTFLYSRKYGDPIAMYFESTWSWNEVKSTLNSMETQYGEDWGFMKRRQAFFPVPRKSAETKGNVLWTIDRAFAIVNNNTEGPQREIANLFFQYCYTDEALNAFTKYTGMTKAVNYDVVESEISYVANAVQTIRNAPTTKVVQGNAQSKFYYANFDFFDLYWEPFHTRMNKGTQDNPFVTFRDTTTYKTITAVDYFNGLYQHLQIGLPTISYNY